MAATKAEDVTAMESFLWNEIDEIPK
jgi:hypothetical protein